LGRRRHQAPYTFFYCVAIAPSSFLHPITNMIQIDAGSVDAGLLFFSCVVDFRLETVIIPSWFCSEVVVCAACTLTTTSFLWAAGGLCGC